MMTAPLTMICGRTGERSGVVFPAAEKNGAGDHGENTANHAVDDEEPRGDRVAAMQDDSRASDPITLTALDLI